MEAVTLEMLPLTMWCLWNVAVEEEEEEEEVVVSYFF